MKCISLYQPWATLIAIQAKRFETRGWKTNHRGKLLIHAGTKIVTEAINWTATGQFAYALLSLQKVIEYAQASSPLPYGAIVAVCDLVECYKVGKYGMRSAEGNAYPHRIQPAEALFGDFSEGRYAWQLENVQRFKTPVRWKGAQGLFEVPGHVVAEQMGMAVAV